MELINELNVSIDAAIRAGEKIMEIYSGSIEVEYKENNTPLTLADREANDIIVDSLLKNFPKYSILSEEKKDTKDRLENDWCWIVDPLDGTKEFIKKNGEFTVNIALSYKHKSVLGVIYVPVTKELYYAVKGSGAYLKSEHLLNKLQVSNKKDDLILVASRSHTSKQLSKLIEENKNKFKEVKNAGSSLKGCLIAKGEADVYYRFGLTSEWDTAAMQCIVEEAGGIFKQLDSSDMLYNRENTLNEKGFYIVNNGKNIFNIQE
ncbi:inositol monophosphatase [Clostridium carboxidivorans P7]|uniref:3'(2'),5'-bisphosphate nucleotidase CysQ n=1 Tax=Clostridium carboxidivorans P7 TaxID=536227 RepID=C6PP05_9CLOT|nr:3'(2'),5'-bisphosphate nucleotidase CysQ [Clostridium carboxidivorans]AKN31245.1 inositol monophosphatase [Clostridium carboxidivorans P7]EET89083.1 inositol monophosphatase [Clostridium carboxidivorans P7]EFG88362.1 putative 3'(2'),5'-bisphosphate nucleotidase [Clostridium carboxidivorans P7]